MSEEMSEERKSKAETKAEIRKLNAEAALSEVEARKAEAELKKLEAEASEAQIRAEKAYKTRQRELSTDEENYLYRYHGEVSKASVKSCMLKLSEWSRLNPKCDIEIVFASGGGSIIDGFELFDFIQDLRSKGHQVTTGALGMAASMAGILLQAGSHRWIGHQAWMMIHRAAFGAIGKTFEVEDEVKFVKRIEERILNIFIKRSKLSRLKIKRNWDRKDWWISADECKELGLVDEIRCTLPDD